MNIFPTINQVARELRHINARVEGERIASPEGDGDGVDVRLQVEEDGSWRVHSGAADYDTDHHGWWGASSVPGNGKRFGSRDMARELISQAKDQRAEAAIDE